MDTDVPLDLFETGTLKTSQTFKQIVHEGMQ
jgi:hypothetical protein